MVKKQSVDPTAVDLARISDFILLNTLIFHQVLSNQRDEVKSLHKVATDRQQTLLDQWRTIREEVNYQPIFDLAIGVLEVYPPSPQTEDLLDELGRLAISIVSSGVHLRHDLMGRLYHKLLLKTVGGFYATNYTSVPAAVLLSGLTMVRSHPTWNFDSPHAFDDFHYIDPACGSGTLLSALYSAIRHKFVIDCPNPDSDSLKKVHRTLLEHGAHGYDVLDYATHLSLTTLAMHNPRAQFEDSNIWTLANGIDTEENIFLGSLDFLDPQRKLHAREWSPSRANDEDGDLKLLEVAAGEFDVVVMNPPFSRSANPNLKFGYETPQVRKKMGKRLRQLTKLHDMSGIGVAGMGPYFIVLADILLKQTGRLATVIPRHILSGVSWQKIRDLLIEGYELEFIVSNFDPDKTEDLEGWSWSEETDLGEVLLMARKEASPKSEYLVTFVNITNQPSNDVEASFLTQEILKELDGLDGDITSGYWTEITAAGEFRGFVYNVSSEDLQLNWHAPCVFSHPELNGTTLNLLRNSNLVPLEAYLSSKGRDIAGVKNRFRKAQSTTGFPILYGHNESMNTIGLDAEHVSYGVPKSGEKSEEMHANHASDLLIAERPHINSECLLALETTEPVLTTAFWEIKLSDDALRPLLLLWMNSTFGFMTTLGVGANSKAQNFKVKQDHLGSLPIPEPSEKLLQAGQELYEEIRDQVFRPFPEEFNRASEGEGPRHKIDKMFQNHLEFDHDLETIYAHLTEEPALTGNSLAPH